MCCRVLLVIDINLLYAIGYQFYTFLHSSYGLETCAQHRDLTIGKKDFAFVKPQSKTINDVLA